MKKFLFTALLFCLVVSYADAYAQVRKEAVVKLKSGIEVRGEIIDEVAGESLTLKTAEGDLFIYTMKEIVRIDNPNAAELKQREREAERQAKVDERLAIKNTKQQQLEERALGNFKGYRGIFEFTYGHGFPCTSFGPRFRTTDSVSLDYQSGSVSFINGYNCGPKFFIGVGVGCQYIFYSIRETPDWKNVARGSYINIPLFVHLRSAFTRNRRVSPYFSINLGYVLEISTNHDTKYQIIDFPSSSGVYAEPSLGLEFRCKKKTAVFFAVSAPIVLRTDTRGYLGEGYFEHFEDRFVVPVGLKFGFSF